MITYQRFMVGACLQKSSFPAYAGAEHEHCTMCGAKFSANTGDLKEGYVALEGNHWVCPECMRACKDEYGWHVKD